eukprot:297951-Pyramimonas_sp.AAC.1
MWGFLVGRRGHFRRLERNLQWARPEKTLYFSGWSFLGIVLGASWAVFGAFSALWGAVLRVSWAAFEASWARLGASWGAAEGA